MYKEFAKIYDVFMDEANYDSWYNYVMSMSGLENIERTLDVGCGSGEFILRARESYKGIGVDLSSDMLERAKEKLGSSKDLYMCDMRRLDTLDIGKFDLIVSLFDTINHLTSVKDLRETFKGIEKKLSDKGVYIFDVVDEEFMEEMFPNGVFTYVDEDYTLIWEYDVVDEKEGVGEIKATYFIKESKDIYKKTVEKYKKKIYTRKEIEGALEGLGLGVQGIYEEDTLAGYRTFYKIGRE